MPRFTEQEKERIKEKLLLEGEKLFASVGLRKITIDNLTEAVGISHSVFYSFYENKEQLFMEMFEVKESKFSKVDLGIIKYHFENGANLSLLSKSVKEIYS